MMGDHGGTTNLAGKQDQALKTSARRCQIDPYTFWARYRMARLFDEQKQNKEALEQYELR